MDTTFYFIFWVQSYSNEPIVTNDSSTNGPFLNILIFSYNFFCNMFFTIFMIPPINYIIYVNIIWINMNFLKVYKFCQILCFIFEKWS